MLLAGSLVARADDDTVTMPDLIQGAQQWAQENLDTNVLNAPAQGGRPRGAAILPRSCSSAFKATTWWTWRRCGIRPGPSCRCWKASEETQPYAAWLKAQMDYLDVADEIRLTIPPPNVETNQPPQPVPNPPPQKERELWVKKVSVAPWPASAKEYVPELKPIFTAQKIPPELVWVAEVESDFDRRGAESGGSGGIVSIDAGHGQAVRSFPVAARPALSAGTERDRLRAVSESIFTIVSRIGGSRWPPTTPGKARCRNFWTATKRAVTTPSPNICQRKRNCTCPGSKPSSSNVKARTSNNFPYRKIESIPVLQPLTFSFQFVVTLPRTPVESSPRPGCARLPRVCRPESRSGHS